MDETRRLREPTAWLLLAVVFVTTLAGVFEMLSALLAMVGTAQSGALSASGGILGPLPSALPFFAVLLATKFGPVLGRARVIVIAAMAVQGFAALIGLIAWIMGSFGAGTTLSILTSQFVGGALWLALIGVAIFYDILVLKTPELAPKPKPQPAPQQQGYGPQYPGAPGGYPGQPGFGYPGQPGQTGQQQPYGVPPGQPGQPGPQPGYPSGQQAPMPGYQPQEYGQPDSTSQMPAVGEPAEAHNFGAPSGPQQPGPGFASGPQPGYGPPPEAAGSGPQFAPPPAPGGQPGAQPGWPGGYGQQASGPQQPGPGWFAGQEAPQPPDPYGQGGGFGQQPGPGGPGAFGQQPEPPSPYQEPPSPYQEPQPPYQEPQPYGQEQPSFGQEPPQFGGAQGQPEQPTGGEQQQNGQSGGFDALFGGRPDSDEPDDVQRTSRIQHDPEAFRRYQPPPGDQ